MAKDTKQKVTVEVDPNELGVLTRHHFLMANDQDYRNEALTPPGGKAPGEDGKPEAPLPDGDGLTPAVIAAAA